MLIEQYVMAYSVEQDRLRALLPDGFTSLRPVLRINAEIAGDKATLELNTAAERDGQKGWLNIASWSNVDFERKNQTTVFNLKELKISFALVGIKGSCPAEKDNCGTWFLPDCDLRLPEVIKTEKEFCDCEFSWYFKNGTSGKSLGKTLPAICTDIKNIYPKLTFSTENFAAIECEQVLGSYFVIFER